MLKNKLAKPLYDYSICGRCGGSRKVLGVGLYNYEPCPKCWPEERSKWEEQEAQRKQEKA